MWFIPTETGREVKTWASNKAVKLLGQSSSAPWGRNYPPPHESQTHSSQPAVSEERAIAPRMWTRTHTPHVRAHVCAHRHWHGNSQPECKREMATPTRWERGQWRDILQEGKESRKKEKLMDNLDQNIVGRGLAHFWIQGSWDKGPKCQ